MTDILVNPSFRFNQSPLDKFFQPIRVLIPVLQTDLSTMGRTAGWMEEHVSQTSPRHGFRAGTWSGIFFTPPDILRRGEHDEGSR